MGPKAKRLTQCPLPLTRPSAKHKLLDKKPAVTTVVETEKTVALQQCQPHIVFSTFKCQGVTFRQKIEDNTLHAWSKLENVTFEVISNAKTNKHGVPILGDM